MPTRVQIINETSRSVGEEGWLLCFQWCLYIYEDGNSDHGYRFIYRKPNGYLQPARGQARIPSIKIIEDLINEARDEDWGYYEV